MNNNFAPFMSLEDINELLLCTYHKFWFRRWLRMSINLYKEMDNHGFD